MKLAMFNATAVVLLDGVFGNWLGGRWGWTAIFVTGPEALITGVIAGLILKREWDRMQNANKPPAHD